MREPEYGKTGESSIKKNFSFRRIFCYRNTVLYKFLSPNFFFKCFLCCVGDCILVSTFWRPELFVPILFVAGTFCRCKILPPKNKNLPLLYETRAIFSNELCCRKFCYRRLTCISYEVLGVCAEEKGKS